MRPAEACRAPGFHRLVRTSLICLLLAAALAGCERRVDTTVDTGAVARASKPTPGDTLIVALPGNVSGLIPNITGDKNSHDAVRWVYNGLITHDKDINIVPDLAESWDLSSNCLDLTFKLRKNVRWHDGRPFTADDVVFTYNLMVHPKTPSPYKDDFEEVESVAAVDPHTVHIRYKQPYAPALMSWGQSMLPRHLLESYMLAGKLREAPQNFTAPVGTGPYRFKEMHSGDRIVVVANPDYYAGPPYIARIVYRIIASQAVTFLELKTRGVDSSTLTALQYRRQTDYPAFRKAYRKFRYAANVYTYLGLNHQDPRFADKRVRQAIANAIDRRDLIDGVRLGLAREATGPYQPGTWAHNPNVRTYPYDPARARALLAEAGWKTTNADGILVKDGQPFAFELLISQGNDEGRKIAEIIQAQLREIGIDVELRVLEWAAFLRERIKTRRFTAAVLAWSIGLDADQYSIWHSSQTGPEEFNFVSYANREVDELLERGRKTCVQSDRKRAYDRLQEILAEEQPIIFLFFRDALSVVTTRVRGIVPGPIGIEYNMNEWYVPRRLQIYTAG
jgi:peptide/nickel transport system substrate-binding protein